jgi:signal transduction histidine kinase/ActR/RegA family two-component response regulator
MVDRAPDSVKSFDSERLAALLKVLELMAAGDTGQRLAISPLHDELDAVAHCINVLVGELSWTAARTLEAQEERAAALSAAVVRAEQAVASKNVFLRNVSHEIRTPIAAMLGFADLVATADLSHEDRSDLLRRLQANGQAVLSIVGDLVDLARLDADKISLAPELVCVFDLVREVVASLEIESRAKGIDVRVEVPSDALGTFQTDKYRLRQILVNLIANAIKFTDAGRILVSLSVVHRDGGVQWMIDVADTGIGIAPDRHPYLFEPFAQADSSITRTFGGAGLGLALSRRLAEQLDGNLVLLHSAPGRGTTFRLTLNVLPLTPGSESSVPTEPDPPQGELNGLRILLAEDHADMQLAVRRLLEQAGASVTLANDGREAVAKAMSETFDVVLMDLRMPHMDGLQATRVLREEGCRVPIVALTADPATVYREEALDGGCDECLSKPFIPRELVASIRSLHDRQSPFLQRDDPEV